jgi:ATP-dependent DNA helicase RecG
MRPAILNPLFAALTTLPGVGPKVEKLYRHLLHREHGARLLDLLFHLPTGAIDRRARPKLTDVIPGSVVTVAVTIDRHRPPPPRRPRVPYLIYASDGTGDIVLTYFNARKD